MKMFQQAFSEPFRFLLCLLLAAGVLSCGGSSGPTPPTDPFSGYLEGANPLVNTSLCFRIARNHFQKEPKFVYLAGVQKSRTPGTVPNLDIVWSFVDPDDTASGGVLLEITPRKITRMPPPGPLGYEFTVEQFMLAIKPLDEVWANCVRDFGGKELLNVKLAVPLVYPPAPPCYYFYAKEGWLQEGVDWFTYDALTGKYLPLNP